MAQYDELAVYKAVICCKTDKIEGILVNNISSMIVASFMPFKVIRHSR